MYYSFLIHSSADGHLGCFHVLAIESSAVMNIGVHVSLSILLPVFLPGKFHKQRSLAGYSPWDCKESDTTEHEQVDGYSDQSKNILVSKIKILLYL